MNTDRELLELAAMASGIEATWHDGILRNTTGFHPSMNIYCAKKWNPLTDDGDALRLAVKMMQTVDLDCFNEVRVSDSNLTYPNETFTEPLKDNDHYAATRRAIVRAAAEIGRAK